MATEAEIAAIRLRWQRITADEWKRLQHWIEDENDFTAHARADIGTLLAALDELAAARAQAERDQAVMQAADEWDVAWDMVDRAINEEHSAWDWSLAADERDRCEDALRAAVDARRAATATPGGGDEGD